MMSTHYHQPLNWTDEGLKQSKQAMDRIYTALRNTAPVDLQDAEPSSEVVSALQDDLNTPKAIAHLHYLVSEMNKAPTAKEAEDYKRRLIASGRLMGLLYKTPEEWFKGSSSEEGLSEEAIEALIEKRAVARKAKDFATADAVRKELSDNGILIEDTPTGTQWKRA